MKHSEIVEQIARQTGKEPKNKDLALIIGIAPESVRSRAFRNKEYSYSEVKEIEKHYNVDFSATNNLKTYADSLARDYAESVINKPVLAPHFDMGVQLGFENWGKRLLMLQVQSGMLDSADFAKYVDIPEKTLNDYIMKSKPPKGEDLLKLKTRFSKTDFNWLLFGE